MSLSDNSKAMGDLLENLRESYPQYKWTTKLHSNVVRGICNNNNSYNIMIVYFRMSKVFEVSIRGLSIDVRANNTDCVIALEELEKQLVDKKKEITQIITDLTKKRMEDR